MLEDTRIAKAMVFQRLEISLKDIVDHDVLSLIIDDDGMMF